MIHQPWALLIQRCFELITYTFRSIHLCLFHMQYRGFFFLPSVNRFLASWPSVTILMLRGDTWKQTIGRLGPQHTHTQKLYLLCLFLNISDSLKVTFPIGGRCSSSKKKRGKSNDQKSSGSVTVKIPLLCRLPQFAMWLFCIIYWETVEAFPCHVIIFLMVLQTRILPMRRIWSVNPALHRATKSSVVTAHGSLGEKNSWISAGIRPNMKTRDPRRGHPYAEQIHYYFCEKNLWLVRINFCGFFFSFPPPQFTERKQSKAQPLYFRTGSSLVKRSLKAWWKL